MRLVFDTNVLVSYLLFPNRAHALGIRRLIEAHTTLHSDELLAELMRVLAREKWAPYFDAEDVTEFLVWYREFSTPVSISEQVHICRDPKDDHVLSLALSGKADCIVTGDRDLLVLDPFRGIAILRVSDALLRYPLADLA